MVMGVDEAGRGPVLGPLVVAAAGADEGQDLGSIGVKDSKMLSPGIRRELFEGLSGMIRGAILIIPASVIDLSRSSMTLNRLEVLAFSSVLASLLTGFNTVHKEIPGGTGMIMINGNMPKGPAILDAADVDSERFGRDVRHTINEMIDLPDLGIVSEHKADRDHPIVGAASILAKVTRDSEMVRISKELGIDPVSGYPADPRTICFLENWVKVNGVLPPHCRSTWKTSRRILEIKKQTDLFSFG